MAGHATFGVVSIVFVVMALLVLKRAPRAEAPPLGSLAQSA